MVLRTNLVDVHQERIYAAEITIEGRYVMKIDEIVDKVEGFTLPGFIDAHIHIESSMLTPTQFSRLAVRHGTIATVSDPHEIGNVLGVEGIQYMIDDASKTPLKFFFGASSCVPATSFETAGSTIDAEAISSLLRNPDIWYLAEMMNYPGVLNQDPEVMKKIAYAQQLNMPIDGHAPGLTGQQAIQYINAGIQTDHECVSYTEALHKASHGMKIIIREGSAAKNFEALIDLMKVHPDTVMFCSDDKHPDDLLVGHIDQLVQRSLAKGLPLFDVLKAASLHPVRHYNLPVGLLQVGDPADFIQVDDLENLRIQSTFIEGKKVFDQGIVQFDVPQSKIVNHFGCSPIDSSALALDTGSKNIRVIKAIDGSLITESIEVPAEHIHDFSKDILKIVIINRYLDQPPAIAYVHGFGIKEGAIASSVAHDSHNIIAVGRDDLSLTKVINLVIDAQGGIACVHRDNAQVIPLPIAGLMTNVSGEEIARSYSAIDRMSKDACGSSLMAPFMTLSFMALLVIPSLKLSDKGLFDGRVFEFVDVGM